MEKQLKTDFEKIIKNSNFSKKVKELKENYLNKFIESGFPNKKLENWKFSDISQIIKKNIGDISFYNDHSSPNKVDLNSSCSRDFQSGVNSPFGAANLPS